MKLYFILSRCLIIPASSPWINTSTFPLYLNKTSVFDKTKYKEEMTALYMVSKTKMKLYKEMTNEPINENYCIQQ